MKTRNKIPFLLCALVAGLGVMPASRATAQNFAAWPVTQIAAGYGHSLLVRGRSILAMGYNNRGQLGDGTTNNHYLPEQIFSVGSTTTINALSAGYSHSLFAAAGILNHNGGLWAMGENDYGQLGDGTYTDHLTPEEVVSYSVGQPSITACAGGGFHTLFIKSDGSLWAMGNNWYGQLGDYLGGLGEKTNSPERIDSNGVVTIAAGYAHSLFIKSDSYLYGMGYNGYGELEEPEGLAYAYEAMRYPVLIEAPDSWVTEVIACSAGGYHSLYIGSDGRLWAVGDNLLGQLGIGGNNYYTDAPQLIASNVVAVAGGFQHSLFIKSDGSLWGMGYNGSGQLGTGDYIERDTPVEIVAPPPQISIIPYGANVILAWPTNAAAFVLQSTTSLTSPNWTTVTPGPVIVGNQCEVFDAVSGQQNFYRLVLSQ